MSAFFIALAVVALTIRFNSFVPWGTDSGAYLHAAQRWAGADLYSPQTFLFRFPWASDRYVESPLGHRPGETPGTYTSFYPLGYPVLLAAALKIGGELAPYVVAPLFAGVLAWCAFLLGRALSGVWSGVIAALLIAATPVTLNHAVMAMGDVPATAFWALAWVMSLRAGLGATAAAGAAAAMAVMIRPNLAPLAVVIGATAATSHVLPLKRALSRLVVFGAFAALGPAMVLWSQAVLYGGALNSGYPASLDFFFNTERIPFNARIYPLMFARLHTWLPMIGVAMLPVAIVRARRRAGSRVSVVVAIGAAGIIAINDALYLAYLSFEDWQSLRFLLPAMLALFVLFAAVLAEIGGVIARYRRWLAPLAALPALAVAWTPRAEIRATFVEAGFHSRLQLMGRYLREAMPANGVILTYVHGGALALYTGRPIIRMDVIARDALDRIVADLQRGGHRPAFVLDLAYEYAPLAERFKGSPLITFDWRPRAEFATLWSAYYHEISDRERFLSGDARVVDVVRRNRDTPQPSQWVNVRPPGERFALPSVEETAAFRTALERTYRTDLRRPATATRLNPGTALLWTRRYLRARIHGCDHERAVATVFDQIDGGGPQPLCARPAEPLFPPRNETVDFRRRLDAKFPAGPDPSAWSAVDVEGEAVWLEEYVRRRLAGCSHAEATDAVQQQIVGGSAREC